MNRFIAYGGSGLEHALNSYIYDFYMNGQVEPLTKANGIKRGDIWYLLQDFDLCLKAVKTSLEQLRSGGKANEMTQQEDIDDGDSDDPASEDEWSLDGESFVKAASAWGDTETATASSVCTSVSPWSSVVTRALVDIVSEICDEFNAKFRAMWA
ncbi:hypothetical protein FISHEDRAFT_76421 [Fistulina hepatica ATCC 64428]|uniref:Uncharacterized protein n=1 Tax=Fistulina hepatica ATCC 64428 TaxID=1128425 RepID=A0A0D7A6M4_9AGAR|nr:hypothetical protein FISHEDRAFT_76421 [Fistulina hepatica ATCC 64428]